MGHGHLKLGSAKQDLRSETKPAGDSRWLRSVEEESDSQALVCRTLVSRRRYRSSRTTPGDFPTPPPFTLLLCLAFV